MQTRLLILIGSIFLFLAGTYNMASFAGEELFDTKTAAIHLEKGIAHLKTKNYNAAIAELEQSTAIAPDAEAYYYLGYAYYLKGRAGDYESKKISIECFDKAYELDPNFSPTRYKIPENVSQRRPRKISNSVTSKPTESTSPNPAPDAASQSEPADHAGAEQP